MPRQETLNKYERVVKRMERGETCAEARLNENLSSATYYEIKHSAPQRNSEKAEKRKYTKKAAQMITLPVIDDKVCVFVGSPEAAVKAAREFMR